MDGITYELPALKRGRRLTNVERRCCSLAAALLPRGRSRPALVRLGQLLQGEQLLARHHQVADREGRRRPLLVRATTLSTRRTSGSRRRTAYDMWAPMIVAVSSLPGSTATTRP